MSSVVFNTKVEHLRTRNMDLYELHIHESETTSENSSDLSDLKLRMF